MNDYQPRTKPLIPVGHRVWLAVSRVKAPTEPPAKWSVAEQIEDLLMWITSPGADQAQRNEDLLNLAELVLANRGSLPGYGVAPIDSDTHDPDCITCGDARVYEVGGHEPDFDRHPYETKEA